MTIRTRTLRDAGGGRRFERYLDAAERAAAFEEFVTTQTQGVHR